ELHREDMTVAVSGDLVAVSGDLPDERGFPLRHPPEDEERGAEAVLRQEGDDDASGVHDPSREALPVSARKDRAQVLRVEPLLDVERQEARHRPASAAAVAKTSRAHRRTS